MNTNLIIYIITFFILIILALYLMCPSLNPLVNYTEKNKNFSKYTNNKLITIKDEAIKLKNEIISKFNNNSIIEGMTTSVESGSIGCAHDTCQDIDDNPYNANIWQPINVSINNSPYGNQRPPSARVCLQSDNGACYSVIPANGNRDRASYIAAETNKTFVFETNAAGGRVRVSSNKKGTWAVGAYQDRLQDLRTAYRRIAELEGRTFDDEAVSGVTDPDQLLTSVNAIINKLNSLIDSLDERIMDVFDKKLQSTIPDFEAIMARIDTIDSSFSEWNETLWDTNNKILFSNLPESAITQNIVIPAVESSMNTLSNNTIDISTNINSLTSRVDLSFQELDQTTNNLTSSFTQYGLVLNDVDASLVDQYNTLTSQEQLIQELQQGLADIKPYINDREDMRLAYMAAIHSGGDVHNHPEWQNFIDYMNNTNNDSSNNLNNDSSNNV